MVRPAARYMLRRRRREKTLREGMIMFREERQELKFEWSHLGDIELGRPNLGNTTTVAMYRLMQFTLRDAAIKHTDPQTAARIFYDAGQNAGKALYENMLGRPESLDDFVAKLQAVLQDLRVGILRIEEVDAEQLRFTLTVAEDLDCSGLPVVDEAVCTFDEGFIAGLLEAFSGLPFRAKEVDCWCTGERVCRFEARPIR
jgi:hypothetical protein